MVNVRPKKGAQISGNGYELEFDGEKWTGVNPTGSKITPRGEMQAKITKLWLAQQEKKAEKPADGEGDKVSDEEGTEAIMNQVQDMVGQDRLRKAVEIGEQLVSKGKVSQLTQLERLGLAILVARKKVQI